MIFKMQNNRITLLLTLFIIGLLLRLLGLLFNGMGDLDAFIFEWGCTVRKLGLAKGFYGYYGIFSYALYGISVIFAEQMPRFWWAPVKFMEIFFEIGILFTLYILLPVERKYFAFLTYWINPWFILHGAWHGFWEGPHTLLALVAVICLRWVRKDRIAWVLVGILLMSSGMFKPQGLMYFVMPVGIFLYFQLVLQGNRHPFLWFISGVSSVFVLTSIFIFVGGGSILAIPRNYLSVVTVMPNLCNACINIWRPITLIFQTILGQSGPSYMLQLPRFFLSLFHFLATFVTLSLIISFCLRIVLVQGMKFNRNSLAFGIRIVGVVPILLVSLGLLILPKSQQQNFLVYTTIGLGMMVSGGCMIIFAFPVAHSLEQIIQARYQIFLTSLGNTSQKYPNPYINLYLILTFASLVIPQIGTKAHINHSYAGLVLLIPLTVANRQILFIWTTMILINLYSHLQNYGLGRNIVVPLQQFFDSLPMAQPLILQINTAFATQKYEILLQFQGTVNSVLRYYMPYEPFMSVISAIQFICVVIILYKMFTLIGKNQSTPDWF